MRIIADVEDNMRFSIDIFEKLLTKHELAHLVFFFASKRKVREFVETYKKEGGCLTCLHALKKLGVIWDA